MYEGDDLDFDMSIKKDDDLTNFKQEAMQVQLMKIADSADDPDMVKNPVRTVTTDDGKEMRVEHGEAEAILKILQMGMKPDVKIKIMKDLQTSAGLEKMIKFVNDKGMVK